MGEVEIKGSMTLHIPPSELQKLVSDFVTKRTGKRPITVIFELKDGNTSLEKGSGRAYKVFGGVKVNLAEGPL